MKRFVILAVVTGLLAGAAATTASAATPVQYRAKLNAICRSFTPRLRDTQATMAAATVSRRTKRFESALRRYLLLSLRQNHQLEGIPVPASLQTQMKPLFTQMKKVDPHIRKALLHSRAGHVTATRSQLKTMSKIGQTLPGQLDAAGLLDCGSNQL
jgi:hypothetical protein